MSARSRGAEPVPTDEVGTQRYERPEQLTPTLRSTRYYTFPGGCVSYRFPFDRVGTPALVFAADQALAFEHRTTLARVVKRRNDLKLCGANVRVPRWRRVVTESPTAWRHRPPARRARRLRARRALRARSRATAPSGRPSATVFHAINDLPGWLYPVLWPFQQFGNLLIALAVGVVVALAAAAVVGRRGGAAARWC